MKRNVGRIAKISLLLLSAIFIVIQFIPYGRGLNNPPILGEPSWDSPRTRGLTKRTCFDCHSNETKLPWYGAVAPASWFIWRDIQNGRAALNFSEWKGSGRSGENPTEMANEINEGEMPPFQYALFHPAARLSDAEKRQLTDGLVNTVRQSGSNAK